MITIEIHKKKKEYLGFLSKGHAGYAEEGYDIICSAVSVLTVNAINSIEAFTKDKFLVKQDEGLIEFTLCGPGSEQTTLLLDSMVLGLRDIQKNYGNEYMNVIFKEV